MKESAYSTLLSALGLPENVVQSELGSLIQKMDKNPNEMSLDDLRLIVGEYLQDTFSELKDELEA